MAEEQITEDAGQLVVKTPLLKVLRDIQNEQAAGFARIETSMANKADKSDMVELRTTLVEHGRAIGDLQTWRHESETTKQVSHRFWSNLSFWAKAGIGFIGAILLIAATLLAPYVSAHL